MKAFWKNLYGNRTKYLAALCIGIVYSAICVVVPTLSGEVVNSFIYQQDTNLAVLLLFLGVSSLQIIFFLLDQKASKSFDIHQKRIMRANVFQAISRRDQIKKEKIAEYSSFLNNDIPVASNQFFLGTIDIVKCLALIGFSAASLMFTHYILGFIVVALSIAIVCIPNIIRKKSGSARKDYSQKMAAYNSRLQSYLGGLRVIAFFSYRKRACDFLEQDNDAVGIAEIKLAKHQRFVQGVTAFLQTLKTVLILVLGVILISKREIDVGGLIVVLELDEVIGAPIEVLSYIIHGRNEARPLVKEYSEIVASQSATTYGETSTEAIDTIQLKDVKYHIDGVEILNGVTAVFEKQKKYIITGPSGSGKSTLMDILARICKVTSGDILINGCEVGAISKDAYRTRVCAVFQEPYIFEATLEENILMGRNISQERYQHIIEQLQLSYLLERYATSTISEELTNTLSGGEKQRICLARAMVGQPEVYLLDEVTSALDVDTAKIIETVILAEPATVIHVCHKPTEELLKKYDEHFVLDHGVLQNK